MKTSNKARSQHPVSERVPRTIALESVDGACFSLQSKYASAENHRILSNSTIIQYPPDTGLWYILRCEDHQLNFRVLPLVEALSHLSHYHRSAPATCAATVSLFGIQVDHCTEALAHMHNSGVLGTLRTDRTDGLSKPRLSQQLPQVCPKSHGRFSEVWPDDLPTSLIYRLQAHDRTLGANERPAHCRNAKNLFACPFCRSNKKEFARFGIFIKHLERKHS
ncbi:hypothetical protein BKA60DRAFT_582214 [Fusarium oxysporum]|nr:hypothetical protein BKA60DRAFT_582214 [Fusarium oxysporum]